MGFVGNYAPCGLSPQTDGMPVIRKKAQEILLCLKIMNIPGLYPCFYTLISAFIPSTSQLASRMGFTTSARNSSTCLGARPT